MFKFTSYLIDFHPINYRENVRELKQDIHFPNVIFLINIDARKIVNMLSNKMKDLLICNQIIDAQGRYLKLKENLRIRNF
jgi:hypothetical protein